MGQNNKIPCWFILVPTITGIILGYVTYYIPGLIIGGIVGLGMGLGYYINENYLQPEI